MKVVNLTSHAITDVHTGITIPASGRIARVKTNSVKVNEVNGIPVYKSESGNIEGLPSPEKDIMYVVSSLVLNSISSDRTDVVAPGNLQRNEHGQPVGCAGFRVKG